MAKPEERAWSYVTPFIVLMAFLAVERLFPFDWAYAVRTAAVLAVIVVFSRRVLKLRPVRPLSSVLLGIGVCALWIAPDLLFPGYRNHWLFQNSLTGRLAPGSGAGQGALLLALRAAGSALVVPVAEELFWRAWLMRWLISPRFCTVPLGAYSTAAFWMTAVLFASEHGAFWDVGLAAGIAYNWWIVRTRSLADCILAHGVTNACLAGYVVAAGAWQYWS